MFLYIIAVNYDGVLCAPIKVGVTNDTQRRLREIQTANHLKLGIFSFYEFPDEETARRSESFIHSVLSNARLEGEWFDIEPQRFLSKFFRDIFLKEKMMHLSFECNSQLQERIALLESILGEQEELLERIFEDKFKDPKVFDLYNNKMKDIYSEQQAKIDGCSNRSEWFSYKTPYWMHLVNRMQVT
jgi:hypothetical protein